MTRGIRLNGHLRGPVTLAHIADRLALELPLHVFYDSGLSGLRFEQHTFRLWDDRSNPQRHRRGSNFKCMNFT